MVKTGPLTFSPVPIHTLPSYFYAIAQREESPIPVRPPPLEERVCSPSFWRFPLNAFDDSTIRLFRCRVAVSVNPGRQEPVQPQRGGTLQTTDVTNHFLLNGEMNVAGSTYWKMVYGQMLGAVKKHICWSMIKKAIRIDTQYTENFTFWFFMNRSNRRKGQYCMDE